ncbi:MAG: UpxY family transcription antiterminator, partial [Bacteroidetes bacterium]
MTESGSAQKETPINQIDEHEARWFAVYTGFRKEKRVRDLLQKKGISCFLPLQHHTRIYTRKVKKVSIPLISCYVFVHITKREYVPVLQTEYVLQFVRFKKDLLAIPSAEIDILKRVVGELEVEIEPASLKRGDKVEIIGGQLTGLKGTLESIKGKQKLLIALETLGM